MDRLVKIYRSLSKREKILILIFFLLSLEFVLYLNLFSNKIEASREFENEKINLINDIETKKEMINSINSLKEENKNLNSKILKLENESFSKLKNFKDEFSNAKISTDENNMSVDFILSKDKINNLKNILNYGDFDTMKVSLLDDDRYQIICNFKNTLDNSIVVPVNNDLDKNLNLKKEYFKSKVSNFSQVSKEELNKKFEVKPKEIKQQDIKEEVKLDDINFVEDNIIKENVIKEDIKDTNILNLNYDNFIAFASNEDEVQLIEDENKLFVYYDLKKDNDMFIFFNELIDLKSFVFDVQLTNINGKIGILERDEIFLEVDLSLDDVNKIEFNDLNYVKGIVYRPSEDEKGLLVISNVRGSK